MESKVVRQRASRKSKLAWRCDEDEEQKAPIVWACARQYNICDYKEKPPSRASIPPNQKGTMANDAYCLEKCIYAEWVGSVRRGESCVLDV